MRSFASLYFLTDEFNLYWERLSLKSKDGDGWRPIMSGERVNRQNLGDAVYARTEFIDQYYYLFDQKRLYLHANDVEGWELVEKNDEDSNITVPVVAEFLLVSGQVSHAENASLGSAAACCDGYPGPRAL
eukprot:GHVU01119845.1.p1 GENE.GHVU01119845.1~~GHVU01119845.1.p1  ORF type:complete len:130 (-),score=11.94 GHVU01119845.1:51-440(-)